MLFKNAFTSNPKCSPCRASILTGRNTWQLKEAVSHNGLFPAGLRGLSRPAGKGRLLRRPDRQRLGAGRLQDRGQAARAIPPGRASTSSTQEPPASGIGRNDYPGNFADFLKQRPKDKPFCFWMGFTEPHRAYEYGSGVRLGKKLADVKVPAFLPDTEIVRRDLLDYAVEVEWGDQQIGRALKVLEDAGELDRTLVVVTSDHGMPFPFVKGQIHEDGFHLPLAMRWGDGIKPGRVVEDFVNVRDLAPTYLELAGLKPHPQMTGKSLAGDSALRQVRLDREPRRDARRQGAARHRPAE